MPVDANYRRRTLKSKLMAFSVVSTLAVLMAGALITYYSYTEVAKQVSRLFEEGLGEASEEYLTNYATETGAQVDAALDAAARELHLMADIAQQLIDDEVAPASPSHPRSARPPSGDRLIFDEENYWWQSDPAQASVVSVFGSILDRNGQIPVETQRHIALTARLVPTMTALERQGVPKQWIYTVGPKGSAYIRLVPWNDLASESEAKYPGLNQTDYWDFFFPGIYEEWESWLESPDRATLQKQGFTVVPPYIDAAASGVVLSMYKPLWTRDRDRVNGAVSLDLNITDVLQLVEDIHIAGSGFAFIADPSGNLLAVGDSGRQILGLPEQSVAAHTEGATATFIELGKSEFPEVAGLVSQLVAEDTVLREIGIAREREREEFSIILRPLQDHQVLIDGRVVTQRWTLGIVVPQEEIFTSLASAKKTFAASSEKMTLIYVLIIAASLILSYVLSDLLARRVTQGVGQLTEATSSMAKGEYHARAPEDRNDELGDLARSFNNMAHAIEEKQSALIESENVARTASQAKSDFLATMTHEIKTPLTAVRSSTELLLDTTLDEDQTRILQVQRTATDSLLMLIDDILDLSRIESGNVKLPKEDFDIAPLVEEIASIVEFKTQEKGLELRVRVDPQLETRVRGNPKAVRQILLNLLTNAVKFTDEGHVSLRVEATPEQAEARGIRLIVEDSGIGIGREDQEVIFEKFKQAGQFLNRKTGGSGLGLAICKRLAESMGGEITLHSRLGAGSVFTVALPFEPAKSAPAHEKAQDRPTPSPPHARASGAPGTRVLVVEDSPVIGLMLGHLLKSRGIEFHWAKDGLEGVTCFKDEDDFACIIMDIQMPRMNGYDAMKEIRKVERSEGRRKTPIIALTAHTTKKDVELSLEAGADMHMTKPFDHEHLLRTVIDMGARALKSAKQPEGARARA